MSAIDIQHLTFSYEGDDKEIFHDVSFRIDTDWKLGLIARNGKGKTTLLRLLSGAYEYEGKINASVSCTYFPFAVPEPQRTVGEILQSLCPSAQEWEFERELSLLRLDEGTLTRPYAELSHGEQTKALLAGLFCNENGYLLIDEPTNHLDAEARRSVAAYLRRKKSFLLVSHDRAFLDDCIDHVLCIQKRDIEIQSGNCSSWLQNYERRQAMETARNEQLQKDVDRLTEATRRTAAWADRTEASKYGKAASGLKQDKGYVGHKAAKLMQRAMVTQAHRQRAIEEKSALLQNAERCDRLRLRPLRHRSQTLITLTDVQMYYGARKICDPIGLELRQGERIALDGSNGCGKSSLLRLLLGADIRHDGRIETAAGLIVSYVPQTTADLHGNPTEYARAHRLDERLFFAILSKMDVQADAFGRNIETYSEGQKKKILLAKSLCQSAHVYIWDEPLNYIDMYSRMQIEQLLLDAQATMLFVEHDRAFRDRIATRTVTM